MRHVRGALGAIAATLSTAGLSSAHTAAVDSGIRGQLLYGPTCPVQRVGDPCVRPYRAELRILRARSHVLVARVHSGTDGRFSVPMGAGRYLLVPTGGHPYPRGAPQSVTVRPHRYSSVTITFDSGIR